jgi:protocatechuate 3,4-dioxygenase beta subunit
MLVFPSLALMVLGAANSALPASQEPAATQDQVSTASVSGRVTVGDKAAPGVSVQLRRDPTDVKDLFEAMSQASSARATTNPDGTYQIADLPPGKYTVVVGKAAFVLAETFARPEREIVLTPGETVKGVDFSLVRGGVITGRVTQSDGRALVGGFVNVRRVLERSPTNVEAGAAVGTFGGFPDSGRIFTDDRGIYRAFGLAPGQYKVGVTKVSGSGLAALNDMVRPGTQTFYPGVTDDAHATPVDVKSGSETTGVDIRLGQPDRTFSASGRVIDSTTGRPVPGIMVIAAPDAGPVTGLGGMSQPSNSRGEFKLDKLTPGHYRATPFSGFETAPERYAEPAEFEIKTDDVTGLVLKLKPGGSISGIVTVDENSDSVRPPSIMLMASGAGEGSRTAAVDYARATVAADGSFKLSGLAPGRIRIIGMDMQSLRTISIARIERDGLPQPEGIEIGAGEHVAGIRVVVMSAGGTLRGQVRIEGKLPDDADLVVTLSREDGGNSEPRTADVEEGRPEFEFDDLAPGRYTVTLSAMISSDDQPAKQLVPPISESVTITANGTSSVTLVLKLSDR